MGMKINNPAGKGTENRNRYTGIGGNGNQKPLFRSRAIDSDGFRHFLMNERRASYQ